MRELTLLETAYLSLLLLLSLVLPLVAGFCLPQRVATRKSGLKLVWTGQALFAFAAVIVLVSAPMAPYATVFGLVSCICCALALLRRFHKPETS